MMFRLHSLSAPPLLHFSRCTCFVQRQLIHHSAYRTVKHSQPLASSCAAITHLPPARTQPQRLLLLIDASGLIFRQYFGFKNRFAPLVAPVESGSPESVVSETLTDGAIPSNLRDVGALYGYTNSLLQLCHQLNPSHVVAAMDLGRTSSFRYQLFNEYKSDRPPVEESLKWQLSQLRDVTRALGITPVDAPGFEADDVIGTLAQKATSLLSAKNSQPMFDRVIILSSDKDFIQCLSPNISILSPKSSGSSGAIYSYLYEQEALEAVGVAPQSFIDYLMLLGDVVDGIPGVKGVGEVTARKLLAEFKSLDRILDHVRTHRSLPVRSSAKLCASLLEHEQHFPLWRQLATIRTDVPLHLQADQTAAVGASSATPATPQTNPSSNRQDAFWQQFEFRSPAKISSSPSFTGESMWTLPQLYERFQFPAFPHYLFAGSSNSATSVTAASSSLSPSVTPSVRLVTQLEWKQLSESKAAAKTAKRKKLESARGNVAPSTQL